MCFPQEISKETCTQACHISSKMYTQESKPSYHSDACTPIAQNSWNPPSFLSTHERLGNRDINIQWSLLSHKENWHQGISFKMKGAEKIELDIIWSRTRQTLKANLVSFFSSGWSRAWKTRHVTKSEITRRQGAGRREEKRREGVRPKAEGVNMIKVHFTLVWKCHNKAILYN